VEGGHLVQALGLLGAVLSTTSFVPQGVKALRERDTGAISKRMYLVTVTGFAVWLLYGVLLGSLPIILANAACLARSATILAMKIRYG